MKKLSIFLLCFFQAAFALDIEKLIKVTNENNSQCVEYYTYKGEVFCSTKAQSSNKADPQVKEYETQKIVFDERPWEIAWGKKDAQGTIVEYVPAGDNIEKWNELVTSQFFPGLEKHVEVKDFAEYMMENLRQSGFKPEVTIIKDSPNELLFEFKIKTPKNMQQDELQKITKTKEGLYVLHYVIKKPDMGVDNREKWINNLNESKIK